jgi:hypothetical protein
MYVDNTMSGYDGIQSILCAPPFDGINYDSDIIQTAVFSRDTSANQNIVSGSLNNVLSFNGPATVNNIGTVPISYSNNIFTNTSLYTTAFQISYSITWVAHNHNQGFKQSWISKNSNFNDRYGLVTIQQESNIQQVTAASVTLVLAPNETFIIRVYQNTGNTLEVEGGTQDRSKIQITQIK